jgi:hypothetical protein
MLANQWLALLKEHGGPQYSVAPAGGREVFEPFQVATGLKLPLVQVWRCRRDGGGLH